MSKMKNEEAINIFNEILEGSKLPQKSLEINEKTNIIIARNRFGKIIDKWYISDGADPIVMIKEICNHLIAERR